MLPRALVFLPPPMLFLSEPASASAPSKLPGKIITCKVAFIGQEGLRVFCTAALLLINAVSLAVLGCDRAPHNRPFISGDAWHRAAASSCQGEALYEAEAIRQSLALTRSPSRLCASATRFMQIC